MDNIRFGEGIAAAMSATHKQSSPEPLTPALKHAEVAAIAAFQAEVARLRAALEEVLCKHHHEGFAFSRDCPEEFAFFRGDCKRARAALGAE